MSATGWTATLISHDHAVVQAYQARPLVHDRISARLARFIADARPAPCWPLRRSWRMPTLLMYAGATGWCNPAGSRAFAAAAPPQTGDSALLRGLYHEIFNEVDREPVFASSKPGWTRIIRRNFTFIPS